MSYNATENKFFLIFDVIKDNQGCFVRLIIVNDINALLCAIVIGNLHDNSQYAGVICVVYMAHKNYTGNVLVINTEIVYNAI